MAEEKDTNFKITDRRKFNADGTPREHVEEPKVEKPEAAKIEQAEVSSQIPVEAGDQPDAESVRDNVVSFPGESAKKKEAAESQASPDQTPDPGEASDQQNEAASARTAQAKAAASAAEQAYNQTKGGSPSRMPEASFLALVDMLAGEAAMCLGMVKHPTGAEMPIDLDTARHLIDMLGMLQQKTMGNLSAEENDVLENILAYLRMQFVSLSRKA
jgi:hypothetical protein